MFGLLLEHNIANIIIVYNSLSQMFFFYYFYLLKCINGFSECIRNGSINISPYKIKF